MEISDLIQNNIINLKLIEELKDSKDSKDSKNSKESLLLKLAKELREKELKNVKHTSEFSYNLKLNAERHNVWKKWINYKILMHILGNENAKDDISQELSYKYYKLGYDCHRYEKYLSKNAVIRH